MITWLLIICKLIGTMNDCYAHKFKITPLVYALIIFEKLQSNLHLCNHNMPRHRYSHKYFFLLFVKFDVSSSFSQQRESQSQRYEDGKKVYDSSMSKSRYVLVVAFIMPKLFQKASICVPSLFSYYLSNTFCIYLFSHTTHISILWCQ